MSMTKTKYDRAERNIRWLIGWFVYLVCAFIASLIVEGFDLWSFSTPILVIFSLGYLAGRISKGIEQ